MNTSITTSAKPPMSLAFIVILSSMSFAAVAISIDAIVPILGLLSQELAISLPQAQLSLTVLIITMGTGQILFGPLADRLGRKPALVYGIIIYLLGSLLCMATNSLTMLLIGRACQGVGAAAPVVISRAILRDLYSGKRLARVFSLSYAVMGLVPLLIPALSYALALQFGWRSSFVLLTVYAGILLAILLWKYQETLAQPKLDAMRPAYLWRASVTVLTHPQSLFFLVLLSVVNAGMFAYVISAQRIYIESYAVSGTAFTIFYGSAGIGVVFGQLSNQYLIMRFGSAYTVLGAQIIFAVCCLSGTLLALGGWMGPILFCLHAFVLVTGVMITVANASALIMDPHGSIAGFASSLLGAITFGIGTIFGTLLSFWCGNNPTLMFAGIFSVALTCAVMMIYWQLHGRHRLNAIAIA